MNHTDLQPRTLSTAPRQFWLPDTDITNLLDFASKWAKLDEQTRRQVLDVVEGDAGIINQNKVQLALNSLKGFNEDLDDALEDALDGKVVWHGH